MQERHECNLGGVFALCYIIACIVIYSEWSSAPTKDQISAARLAALEWCSTTAVPFYNVSASLCAPFNNLQQILDRQSPSGCSDLTGCASDLSCRSSCVMAWNAYAELANKQLSDTKYYLAIALLFIGVIVCGCYCLVATACVAACCSKRRW